MKIIAELFKRGDVVSAASLKVPDASSGASVSAFGTIRSAFNRYLWSPKTELPSLDDPIVPVAALKAAADRAAALKGPVASSDILTVRAFAEEVTAGNTRDAEAVISHLVSKGNATVLYTDPTPESPVPTFGVKLGDNAASPADKGVLQTKAALERMEKLSAHLEEGVAAEKAAATVAAKAGNKADALARLRKKNLLETKLTGARSAALKLHDVVMAVDEAASNKEAVLALETGMDSLRLATANGVTADRVDAVASNFDEMLAEQQDVRVALGQLNHDAIGEDAELQAELDELLDDEKTEPAKKDGVDEEMLKIMAELGISKEEAALMPDPVTAGVAATATASAEEQPAPQKARVYSAPEL